MYLFSPLTISRIKSDLLSLMSQRLAHLRVGPHGASSPIIVGNPALKCNLITMLLVHKFVKRVVRPTRSNPVRQGWLIRSLSSFLPLALEILRILDRLDVVRAAAIPLLPDPGASRRGKVLKQARHRAGGSVCGY